MLFSGRNRGKIIGVDIGTTSIKVVELSRSGRSLVVDRYAFEPLTPGSIVDHKIKDVGEVASSLQLALKR